MKIYPTIRHILAGHAHSRGLFFTAATGKCACKFGGIKYKYRCCFKPIRLIKDLKRIIISNSYLFLPELILQAPIKASCCILYLPRDAFLLKLCHRHDILYSIVIFVLWSYMSKFRNPFLQLLQGRLWYPFIVLLFIFYPWPAKFNIIY